MKNKKLLKNILGVAFFATLLLGSFKLALAQGIVPVEGKATGDYTLNDFVQLGVNVAQWILGITGSLTLLMFIYGGFTFLISAGNTSKVEEGKKIIMSAVVGLIIIFASWLIIRFIMQALGLNWSGSTEAPTQYQTQ